MPIFKLTKKQNEANKLLAGEALHCMLFGGSRSGKTFLIVRAIVIRALKSANSRHAILRFRFNHVKTAIVHDTFPKVMRLCFPEIIYRIDKTDWFAQMPNGSQIWFGGLDDKERTEKILGQEYATVYFNESSQIAIEARNVAITRLAQNCSTNISSQGVKPLKLKAYYDCNPPSKLHWSYKLFVEERNPATELPMLQDESEQYCRMQMNPVDNEINLPTGYINTLISLGERYKKRFVDGEFSDANPNALWSETAFELNRAPAELPDMIRIVVAVDPSGADDDSDSADAIGIVAVGVGTDGFGYVLEDNTLSAGPATWGKVVASTYSRLSADMVVAEINFGGAMCEFVIKAADANIPYKSVTASRGKVVRAEPIAALYEQGKIRHVGNFPELEAELCGFSTTGFTGGRSPNRADALIWALMELFIGISDKKTDSIMQRPRKRRNWRAL